jgi:hypothetical protein
MHCVITASSTARRGHADAVTDDRAFAGFEDFWPYYLGEHADSRTRLLHRAGTSTGLLLGVVALLTRRPRFLLAGLVAGYGAAWLSHAAIEHNRPATFSHPLWSLRGDLRLLVGRDS